MSVCRKLPDGTIQKIAGHTILLDANASEVREGTGHLTKRPGNQFMDSQVTFSDPMPDTDYAVDISFVTEFGISALARVQHKTVTGFKLEGYITNSTDADMYGDGGWDFKYIAWKPVKIEGYTALQNKINNPDNTPTIDSMNLVTSDGVARAIENASAVWKGTKAEWNALPATTKIKYDLAVLIDTQLIKSVDRTDGTDSDVADLTNVWTGTQAEWDAMTQAQKDKWDKALIKDDTYIVGTPLEYTTTEQNTHKIWIDGKEIYRFVYAHGFSINASSISTAIPASVISALNIETLISADGYGCQNPGVQAYIIAFDYTVATPSTGLQVRSAQVTGGLNGVIIEYTKSA